MPPRSERTALLPDYHEPVDRGYEWLHRRFGIKSRRVLTYWSLNSMIVLIIGAIAFLAITRIGNLTNATVSWSSDASTPTVAKPVVTQIEEQVSENDTGTGRDDVTDNVYYQRSIELEKNNEDSTYGSRIDGEKGSKKTHHLQSQHSNGVGGKDSTSSPSIQPTAFLVPNDGIHMPTSSPDMTDLRKSKVSGKHSGKHSTGVGKKDSTSSPTIQPTAFLVPNDGVHMPTSSPDMTDAKGVKGVKGVGKKDSTSSPTIQPTAFLVPNDGVHMPTSSPDLARNIHNLRRGSSLS